ncbi:flavin reductase family protein (plasmid) [Diaphorobacter sp. HDW4B]|uniref:flavin reductase family protein n=1 Tax=Diaphorobacter sp. HDW4B TaxID=2714925 RepID=UPI0014087794|nr:flavin reductase family protein [Diaphorobacter sp. HDW4B]QIL73948.1 flavin reductase family protein [Diaphorobacter sp. HDW4B]
MQDHSVQTFDPKAFRAALGTFATGVTVITAVGQDGKSIGLTANSFNSVSLDPPLVLWSLAKKAFNLQDFVAAKHWAVHILSADQEQMSNQFARGGAEKFAGVEPVSSEHGVPLLQNCAARFECTSTFQYEGGDHIIFVGEVKKFERNDHPPLVFHAGKYALASLKDNDFSPPRATGTEPPTFRSDMLGYMVGRARKNFLDSMRVHLESNGLNDYEWRLLTIILTKKNLTASMFERFNKDAALETILATLESLRQKGWIEMVSDEGLGEPTYTLSQKGVYDSVRLLAIAKSHEEHLMEKMGYADGMLLKSLLNKFIQKTEGSSPNLWSDEFVLKEKAAQ